MIRRERVFVGAVASAFIALAAMAVSAQEPVQVQMPLSLQTLNDTVLAPAPMAATSLDLPARADSSTSVALISAAPAGVINRDAVRQQLSLESPGDTVPRRRAVAYSDWYSRRLTIHRYGSYVMLPLFATQYILGNKLLNQKEDIYAARRMIPVDKGLRSTHAAVAAGVGTLFVVNTTTGLWNLIESRGTEDGRMRRTIHAIAMLAADAGFAYTGYLGSRATDRGPPQARQHRNMALTSFGISTAGVALMWFGQ